MVGRELKKDLASSRDANPGEVVLEATGIRAPGVDNVSITVRAGEIVGLGGLVGAGRTELVRAIIGADNRQAGQVSITTAGKKRVVTSYQSAVRAGVGYIPEERRTDGLALTMTVAENINLPNRKELSAAGFQLPAKIRVRAESRGARGSPTARDQARSRTVQRWEPAEDRNREVVGSATRGDGAR